MKDLRLIGLSYTDASREGLRLINRAAETGSWFDLPEKLSQLRDTMTRALACQTAQKV